MMRVEDRENSEGQEEVDKKTDYWALADTSWYLQEEEGGWHSEHLLTEAIDSRPDFRRDLRGTRNKRPGRRGKGARSS